LGLIGVLHRQRKPERHSGACSQPERLVPHAVWRSAFTSAVGLLGTLGQRALHRLPRCTTRFARPRGFNGRST
jgi:hypothetical protein